jgi:hypothetical protein
VLAAVAALSVPLLPQTAAAPSAPGGDEVSLRIIVLESEDEARRVREELQGGANFVALATARSVDPSAAQGGLIGRLPLSSLRPELRTAIGGLAAGELSAVVAVPTGFAIVQVIPDRESAARNEGAPLISDGIAAAGSVKYVFDVSGFADAIEALRQHEKEPGWEQDPVAICRMRSLSLRSARETIEHRLATGDGLADPLDRAQAFVLLGQLNAFQGHMGPAIAAWERALDSAQDVPAARLPVTEALGIAHLHRAGLESGAFHTPVEPCILCGSETRVGLARPGDAVRAVEYFTRYLSEKPDELEVRWLLNVAYMMLGRYPDDVPPQHLLAPAAMQSVEDVGRFTDVAHESGLVSFAAAGGLVVDDFDGDGRFDVVTSSMDTCQPMHFFRRSEDGRFLRAEAGLAAQLGGLNIVHADYDNDGCPDVVVLRGGWEQAQRKSLLRNDCRGKFTDVTAAAGLAVPATSTQTAVWADIDNDGRLDLFVGNENAPAQLFRQRPDGTFVDIAAAAGVDRTAFTKGVTAADYDNDGWQDLYVSNSGGRNFLYRNNGNGTFTELSRGAGVPGPGRGFATWFFDYDNDGWQDLFVASYFISVEESVRTYMGLPNNANTLKLYRNTGDGAFQDVTRQAGLDKVFMPMGANFGDIDNDGFLDIYLGTGNPSYASLLPNVLLRNRGGTSFVDVTASSGTGELHKGHGVAFVDLDDDGDEEIVTEIGGAVPGDAHVLRLYENPGHGNDWLNVKLVGRQTNRSAIGARITVTVEDQSGRTRAIHRTVGSGGSFGGSPLRQHVGLGRGARAITLDIWWPASNTRQRFTGVAVNQSIEVTELVQDYTRVTPGRLPLGPRAKERTHVP